MLPRVVAWGVVAVSFAMVAVTAAFSGVSDIQPGEFIFWGAGYVVFPVVGALIVARQPRNLVGWLLVLIGVAVGITSAAGSYGDTDRPGAVWGTWLSAWSWLLGIGPLLLLLLVFPTGRVPSRRWRPVLVALVAVCTLMAMSLAFTPGPLAEGEDVMNPLPVGIFAVELISSGGIGWAFLPVFFLLGVVAMAVRFRRADGVEREQLKWLMYTATLIALSWAAITFFYDEAGRVGQVIDIAVGVMLDVSARAHSSACGWGPEP